MSAERHKPESGARPDSSNPGPPESGRTTDAEIEIARLAEILRSSSDPILSKNLDGTITSWNRAAERLYGYTAEEAVGQHISLIVPPGLETQIDEFMAALHRGERIEQVETRRITKDGREVEVAVTISPIRDSEGRIVGASAIARDIGALREARRSLEARERRIRLLLESTAEAIYGIDTDGLCTFANPACARLLGCSGPEALIGQNMHDLIHHSRADGSPYPIAECHIYRAFRTGQKVHIDTEVLWRSDGTSFPAEYWSHPIVEDGEIVGAVVTFLDITTREEALAELRREAQRRDEFLAMLSHELRNPLAAVVNASHVLQLADPSDAEQIDEARAIIDRQCDHMARLLDDLLDVGRIAHGLIELRLEPVDLREPLSAAAETVAPMFEEKSLDLRLRLADEPLMVSGDVARLQQIVVNLLTNAARYSGAGTTVTLESRADGDCAAAIVRDRGSGIEPQLLPKVFDLFVQGRRSLHRAEGGLGVGLTLVRDLVQRHGGTVEARSDGVGRGSEFVVRLPLCAEEQPAEAIGEALASARESPSPLDRPLRIVVVEDQEDERSALKLLLELRGHEVAEAADGDSGFELIAAEKPDLALLDIGLPGLDGYQLARLVRSQAELTGVSLVALSGYGAAADIDKASSAGFDSHLTKPASLEQLDRILATARG